jgi:hypothetical protein
MAALGSAMGRASISTAASARPPHQNCRRPPSIEIERLNSALNLSRIMIEAKARSTWHEHLQIIAR